MAADQAGPVRSAADDPEERLRDGSILEARVAKGQKHKFQVIEVLKIDESEPRAMNNVPLFKNLTSIDPDFHYAVGDVHDEVSMRIVDLLCPVGRGQRGLIVAPPRSGKTTLMRQFAQAIEHTYTDVHLMVLLVDERPEEATEWRRSVERGMVFVSTADETSKNHIQLAEAVWKRCMRLVELGEDVILLLDSITRLARAYNNQSGGSGRTMSGGLDSRAMERPRKIFGSARNTETAGSLTILGTTLIETGSRLGLNWCSRSSRGPATWSSFSRASSPTGVSSRPSTSSAPARARKRSCTGCASSSWSTPCGACFRA